MRQSAFRDTLEMLGREHNSLMLVKMLYQYKDGDLSSFRDIVEVLLTLCQIQQSL